MIFHAGKMLASVFMGWSLGSNDAANIFGTAVANKFVAYRRAVLIVAVFVIIGSVLEGQRGFETLGSITQQTELSAMIATFSAAVTVTVMTFFGLPVSTSQAMIGGILGIGILQRELHFAPLTRVFISWFMTPVGAAIIGAILYKGLGYLFNRFVTDLFLMNRILKLGFYAVGTYASYALGANNVANVTGVQVASGLLTPFMGTLVGGASIAFGALTYGKKVMLTIGKKLVPLNEFSAFIAIFAQAITIHIYAQIGVPVSASQAIVGGILGIGLATGTKTINLRTLVRIFVGWFLTPTLAGILSLSIMFIFR